MNKSFKIVVPVLLLVASIVISWLLVTQRPKVHHKPVEIKHPLVSVVVAESETISVPVFTRGTVTPGTEIQLVSEVGGQILAVSDNFANGGFFRKGDELIRIDPLEYNVNIKRAEASVAQAKQVYLQAKAEQAARARVKGATRNALATYEVQVRQAEAAYEAAKAELEATKLQKARTVVRAPFDGRVRVSVVSVGQYVRPGVQLGSIYAVDTAEVRLPLSDRQLGLVDVPLDFSSVNQQGPVVTIIGEYGGQTYYWPGQVVRSEGGLDERNRLLYVIARVDDPYAEDPNQPSRPPLTAGFFVEAKIKGKTHRDLFTIPRRALRNGNQVWVVDNNSQLQRREVDVLYKGKDSIYVRSGLRNGDKVVLSQLDIAVDGMKVRTSIQEPERRESADDMNLLGGSPRQSPVQVAEPSQMQTAEPKVSGVTKQFTRDEVMDMASKVKGIVDDMDEDTRQQAVDSAKKMADALKGIVQASQKTAAQSAPAAQPRSAPAPEQAGMSPLAGLIEQDIQAQQEPNLAAQEPEMTEPEVAVSEPAAKQTQASYAAIGRAAAPEPLMESVK